MGLSRSQKPSILGVTGYPHGYMETPIEFSPPLDPRHVERTALGQDVEDEGRAPAVCGTVLLTLQGGSHRPKWSGFDVP